MPPATNPTRAVRLAIILALAAAAPGAAQDAWQPDTRVGDFQFDLPQGWRQVRTSDGPGLQPGDLGAGGIALIVFLPAQPLNTDLSSWFAARWAQWSSQFRVVDSGQPDAGRTPQGFDQLRVYTRISSPAIGFASFVFAAVKVGSRVESYYFVNNTNSWSYLDALTELEQGLRFATSNIAGTSADSASAGRGVAQSGRAGGLDGLYVGYKMRGLAGLPSHFEYLVFLPDGNALRTLPWEGLEHLDFAAMVKHSRAYCGRYVTNGDTVTITWGDNDVEMATRSGAALKFGHDSYFPVASADGTTLDGTFRREGADLADRFIRFTPDGHFTDSGMLSLIAYALTTDRHVDQGPGSGSYRLARNTLTLRYDDGRTIAMSYFVLAPDEGGERPQAIHVETYRLVRDK